MESNFDVKIMAILEMSGNAPDLGRLILSFNALFPIVSVGDKVVLALRCGGCSHGLLSCAVI